MNLSKKSNSQFLDYVLKFLLNTNSLRLRTKASTFRSEDLSIFSLRLSFEEDI